MEETNRKSVADAVVKWKQMMCLKMPAAGLHACQTPDGAVDCDLCRYAPADAWVKIDSWERMGVTA